MQDFGFYFGLGWEHIIGAGALDHQLFIAALAAIYLLRDWKKVLILVTAFTLGHSLTLALSVYELLHFDVAWVEFLIPCTIVITALGNLFMPELNRSSAIINYALALLFGLVHGMGFAASIRFMLASDQQLAWSLFGFNLGLEAGQLVAVLIMLLLAQVLVVWCGVQRKTWVIFVSAAVFGLSLKMALDRIPF